MEEEITVDRSTKAEDKIRFSQLAAYGAGGIIPIALFNVAGILVGLMGNISLGLSAFWLGAILIVPRLWDALSDPIIGHLSDNTRTRWGRRRPYLLLGGIAVAVSFVVIWWIPKGDLKLPANGINIRNFNGSKLPTKVTVNGTPIKEFNAKEITVKEIPAEIIIYY